MVADRQQNAQAQGILSRGGPAIAVIGIHVILIYVIAASMGVVPVPTVKPPMETVFIQENKVEQKPEPVIQPDIKPPPQVTQELDQKMPLMPPIEEDVPPANPDSVVAKVSDNPPPTQDAVAQDLKATQRVEPIYPAASRRDGEEGIVRLRVLVDERGRPSEVQVMQGSGFARLDDAAVNAVRRWHFQAATNGSNAISAWTQVNISFKLTEKDRR